jgi:branched-chain amino acid transport system permease protein
MKFGGLFVQVIVQGLAIGAVYSLIALGYVMIFKAANVFNFAQGDFVMAGCFIALWLINYLNLPLALGLMLAVIITALLGVLIETVVFHPLLEAPSRSYLISTVAVGIILREVGRLLFGADPLVFPDYLGNKVIRVGHVGVPLHYIWISLTATVIVLLLMGFFRHTKMGKAMRAVSEDRETARLMGINTNLNIKLTYALSSGLGAVAGILIAPVFFASTEMGRSFGLKAFTSFVLGGTDSILGAVVGGLIIGCVENLAGVYISTQYKDAISFIILIAFSGRRFFPFGVFFIGGP